MGITVYRDSAQGKRLLGRIDYEIEDNATFQYDKQYLSEAKSSNEIGISVRLPLDDSLYYANDFAPFFRGLLPEGSTLDGLVNMYQVPRNDYLSLIEQLGCESIGALIFVSDKVSPSSYEPQYLPLNQETIELFKNFPEREVVKTAGETRLSLAGAQSKIAWFLPEGKDAESASLKDWFIPSGTAPSSHIIKLSRKGEEDIALNEVACSKLANACGIEVAKATLIPSIPGAIAIERYDRIWVDDAGTKRLLRLHQEDFCQALGLAPYQKYQPEGIEADYLCMIGDLIDDASDDPLTDKREFAKRLLFNYVIGNSDAHLKNSSFLYNAAWTGRKLAPLYDVTCIPLTGYSTRMAFDIGKHRELSEIDESDLMSIPLDLDLSLGVFDSAATEVIESLEAFNPKEEESCIAGMIDRVLNNAKPRIETVERYLSYC